MFPIVLNTELKKLKNSPIWLILLSLPIIPAIIGTFNYIQNIAILQDGWYSLWTQHTLFTCYFFMPPMIACFCAYIMRLEHYSTNWNLLLSMPISPSYIFLSKLTVVSILIILSQLWIGSLFIIFGKLFNVSGNIPKELYLWLICGTIGSISIAAVQLLLSLKIRNFALPIAIAFIGGIFGLAIHAKGFGVYYPYSLMCLGMRANNPGGPMDCNTIDFIVSNLFFIIISSVYSVLLLKYSDIYTE